ncbi:MAG: thioredoxin family protein [Candidatus Cloacimonadaceae bacterium]
MVIKILGTGCAKCKKLEENVKAALAELGMQAEVEKVAELNKIMDYGVMLTPALVIDEKVIAAGKLLSANDIKTILQKGV